VNKEKISTEVTFFLTGFAFSSWAALVPFARNHTQLSDGSLGLTLLSLGVGSVIAMPAAGSAISRFGCRSVIMSGLFFVIILLPFLASATSFLSLIVRLFIFGAGIGTVDAAMNVQGVMVEKKLGRPLLSGFHALYSFGGVVGAGAMALMFSVALAPTIAALVVSALMLFAAIWIFPSLHGAKGEANDDPLFVLPHGIVWLLGGICFATFLSEGAALDWSGVFLSSNRHFEVKNAGWGYVVFASLMTMARLSGNSLIRKFGLRKVVLGSSLCAAAGWVLLIIVPLQLVSLISLGLIGFGCANIAPAAYSAVGQQQKMPVHLAISAITTLGYAGVLLGPALIGAIANASNLQVAFCALAVVLMLVCATSAIFPPSSHTNDNHQKT